MKYRAAIPLGAGEHFFILDEFDADDDAQANAWKREHYPPPAITHVLNDQGQDITQPTQEHDR